MRVTWWRFLCEEQRKQGGTGVRTWGCLIEVGVSCEVIIWFIFFYVRKVVASSRSSAQREGSGQVLRDFAINRADLASVGSAAMAIVLVPTYWIRM